ncbi:SusF/SusE family outer membrane protein [Flammeovirga sp. EKP202]|uniref:SusF/SusE family outer membrane protein n=1 Tax=Flammeovirga sp. EKP202 TaxID=2770592 RepID=UPI00165EE9B8|nr:SusF/SusE family outer membrane protein [Flammeovirga sp. EKP202]MBD0404681.1 SusF/SusE family outer membrane protein [Flammeovirga sp. EKP202]
MITRLYYYLLGLMILLSVQSCKEDEINDPTKPNIQLEEQVEAFRGEGVQIQANITHELGIKSIRIHQPNWSLDKIIILEEEGSPTAFDLNYRFVVPMESEESVTIEITATSIGGNTTTSQQKVVTKASGNPTIPGAGEMYIVGHGYPQYSQNWNPSDGIEMTAVEAGVYIKKNIQINADAEMKFVGQKGWSPDNFGWVTKGTDPSVTMKNGDDSQPLVFAETGYYDIEFDKNQLICTVTKVGDVAPPAIELPEHLYLISRGIEGLNDLAWYEPSAETISESNKLSNEGNGVFKGTFNLKNDDGNGQGVHFKFVGQEEGYNPLNYGLEGVNDPTGEDVWALTPPVNINSADDYYAVDNTPYATYVDGAGEYVIEVDFYAETVKVTKQVVAEMYIVGSGFTDYDQNWNPSNGIPMQTIEDGVYRYDNLQIEEGAEMKFVGQKGWSPDNFGWESKGADPSVVMLNGDSSQPLVFENAGTYTITFNKNNLTCTVTEVQ